MHRPPVKKEKKRPVTSTSSTSAAFGKVDRFGHLKKDKREAKWPRGFFLPSGMEISQDKLTTGHFSNRQNKESPFCKSQVERAAPSSLSLRLLVCDSLLVRSKANGIKEGPQSFKGQPGVYRGVKCCLHSCVCVCLCVQTLVSGCVADGEHEQDPLHSHYRSEYPLLQV